jgi:hypothetical protein
MAQSVGKSEITPQVRNLIGYKPIFTGSLHLSAVKMTHEERMQKSLAEIESYLKLKT